MSRLPWDHPDADPIADLKRYLGPLPENPVLRESAKKLFPFLAEEEQEDAE